MKKLLLATGLVLLIAGCYNDKYDKLYPNPPVTVNPCDTTGIITYSNDIKPIISANCYNPGNGCHDAVGSAVSGYNYEDSTVLQTNALSGLVVPDINFTPTKGHNTMPKNGTQLPACNINKITRWVNEGAPLH